MLVPSAVIKVAISCEPINLSNLAFSTFKILPFSGNMAWNLRSRPCLADPPAESPSTKYISHFAGSRSWQSANLPGKPMVSITPLRRVISRALRAASRARAASTILPTMIFASAGFSCKNSANLAATTSETTGCTSEETNLSLVCDENFGSGTLTDNTQQMPSRMSSPVVSTLAFLAMSVCSMYWLSVRVMAVRKPVKWVPPSRCGMLLVKHCTVSL